MNTHTRILTAMLLVLTAAYVLAGPLQGKQDDLPEMQTDHQSEMLAAQVNSLVEDVLDATRRPGPQTQHRDLIEFAVTEIFFEENATDEDLGIHFKLDGEGWKRVFIFDAEGTNYATVNVDGSVAVIGLTEIFSESAEPGFDELPRDEFLELFPPGEFTMLGLSVDGDVMLSTAILTHDIPAQPGTVFPMNGDEVDAFQPLILQWAKVADPNPPASVIEAYQVIIAKDEDDQRLREITIDMRATDDCMTVPAEFLEPGTAYKYEIIAVETSGNKTINEVEFSTAE